MDIRRWLTSGVDAVEDWQAVLDLVTVSGWRWQFEIGTAEQPLLTAARVFARDRCAERLARAQSARNLHALCGD